MFAGLKLNPFSAPSDPKLDFRARVVPRLYTQKISPEVATEITAYWSLFWTVFESSYDVLNLLTHADIAKTLLSHPQNISSLITVTANRLDEILHDEPDFPQSSSQSQAGLGAFTSSLLGGKGRAAADSSKPDLNRQLLNCLRVLSRVIPFVFAQDDMTMEERIFWTQVPKRQPKQSKGQLVREESNQFVIGDEEEDREGNTSISSNISSSKRAANASFQEVQTQTLAERLIDTVVDLLFVPGFTLPIAQDKYGSSMTIWENGVGSTTSIPVTKDIDQNRCEVLRFLLILLSKPLYIPANAYYSNTLYEAPSIPESAVARNRWHAYLVHPPTSSSGNSSKKRKKQLTLLCSLLNTALKSGAHYATTSDSLVNTFSGAVGDGYEKLVAGGKKKEDSPRLALVKLCIQTLNILLLNPANDAGSVPSSSGYSMQQNDQSTPAAVPMMTPFFTSPPPTPSTQQNPQSMESAKTDSSNAFKVYLAKLHRQSDLSFIVENMLAIIAQPLSSSLLKMPLEAVGVSLGARFAHVTDFLLFLWNLIDYNPKILSHLLSDTRNVHQILAILVCTCLENRENPAQLGLVKISAFLLQTISAERAFGSSLNTPFHNSVTIPGKFAVQGNAADFLIQSIYTLIFSSRGALNAIYPAFVLTLTNISPYLKHPSIRSSTKLIQLFLSMSTPAFLLTDEANPRLVYYLLEAFNNVIQFQLSDCPHLIYAIIRSHQRFEDLSTFTLIGGVTAIRRARKEKQNGVTSPDGAASVRSSRRSSIGSLASLATPALGTNSSTEKLSLIEEDQQRTERERQSQPTSPVAEYPPTRVLSEKAAGKQRARSTSTLTLNSNNSYFGDNASVYTDDLDTPFISKTGFQPTENWVASWRDGLPLDAISILISECLSKVSAVSSKDSTSAALDYLRSVTLVGLLPPATPIRARRFVHSMHSIIWMSTVAWGSTYVQSLDSAWYWRDTTIRLFMVKQRETVGVQGAVNSLLGQGLGMLNLGGGAASPNRIRSGASSTESAGR